MIKKATDSDVEFLAKASWDLAHRLKSMQVGCPFRGFPSYELTHDAIKSELLNKSDSVLWFTCNTSVPAEAGFFRLLRKGNDEIHKRWGFPDSFLSINWFPWLQRAEILTEQFGDLVNLFPEPSLEASVHTQFRDAYFALLQSGFRPLGEQSSVVGKYALLYLDRDGKFDKIQMKLKKSRFIDP